MKLFKEITLATALTFAAIVARSHGAEAHAHLVSSEPAENKTAMPSPAVLKLKFSEELNIKFSSVEVLGPDKKNVEVASEALDPKDSKILIVTLKTALPNGKYTVNWKAFSQDGHKTHGSYFIEAM